MKVIILKFFLYCLLQLGGSNKSQHHSYLNKRSRRWVFPDDEKPSSTDASINACSNNFGQCVSLRSCRSRPSSLIICEYISSEPIVCCPNDVLEKSKFEKLIVPGCGMRYQSLVTAPALSLKRRRSLYAVVGGRVSLPNSWPWMAALFRKTRSNYRYHCGASLISERYLLTAAHCFAGGGRSSNYQDYKVRVGAHDRNNGTMVGLSLIIIHERYDSRMHYYDIAILKTNDDILYSFTTRPICLPPKYLTPPTEDNAIVTGWGDTAFGGKDSKELKEARLKIFANRQCNGSYKSLKSTTTLPHGITRNMICAGDRNATKDACQGDSGGPLAYFTDGSWALIGIVSFGHGCAQVGFPGVYTKVSFYLDWIASKTQNIDGSARMV